MGGSIASLLPDFLDATSCEHFEDKVVNGDRTYWFIGFHDHLLLISAKGKIGTLYESAFYKRLGSYKVKKYK